ncbi:MAG: fibronectin type III domain-containing protein [Actinomycetes bacterium]
MFITSQKVKLIPTVGMAKVVAALVFLATSALTIIPAGATLSAPSAGPRYVSWSNWGNTEANVTWMAPLTNTGAAITGYQVDAVNGGTTISCTAPVGEYTCRLTGLTNGVAYTITGFALAGTNKSPGVSLQGLTPQSWRPTSPTNVVVDRSFGTTVTWDEPTFFLTGPKSYVVYAFLKDAPFATSMYSGPTALTCTALTTSCTFAPGVLNAASSYNFAVKPIQQNTGGAFSDLISDLPGQLMGGPSLTASTTGTVPSITVSWPAWGNPGAPTTHGVAVVSYDVLVWGVPYNFSPTDAGCAILTICSVTMNNTGTPGTTNAGISYGTGYRPVVRATTMYGTGLYSYQPVAQVFPGHAPSMTGLTASKYSSTSLRIRWDWALQSSNNGGWQTVQYQYEIYKSSDDSFVTSGTVGNIRLASVTGLAPSTTYYCKVRAVTSNSSYSDWATSAPVAL